MDNKLVIKLRERQKDIPCDYCSKEHLCDDCKFFKELWKDYAEKHYFGM